VEDEIIVLAQRGIRRAVLVGQHLLDARIDSIPMSTLSRAHAANGRSSVFSSARLVITAYSIVLYMRNRTVRNRPWSACIYVYEAVSSIWPPLELCLKISLIRSYFPRAFPRQKSLLRCNMVPLTSPAHQIYAIRNYQDVGLKQINAHFNIIYSSIAIAIVISIPYLE
jgi:hypothetical protein